MIRWPVWWVVWWSDILVEDGLTAEVMEVIAGEDMLILRVSRLGNMYVLWTLLHFVVHLRK